MPRGVRAPEGVGVRMSLTAVKGSEPASQHEADGAASTIMIAREDLSIPGSDWQNADGAPDAIERRFFDLIQNSRPDVVVLDLARTLGKGIEAIRKIREQSGVPILAVCAGDDVHIHDYRVAGAAECLIAPIDIAQLNATIQHIVRVTKPVGTVRQRTVTAFAFAGASYRPGQNMLSGPAGENIELTTSENDVLLHLIKKPWGVCSRNDIAEVVYGKHRPVSDRAIDVLINRLRKKIAAACGESAETLIKTEFRRGYKFTADVTSAAGDKPVGKAAP